MDNIVTGLYGKLPAHGDFVHRNLPDNFVNVWDEWLQHYIAGTKEQIGENWLNLYLTSPMWRYMLSEGTIDDSAWSGIVLPSVDKVGRYFPFSIATKLPSNINPLEFLLNDNSWFNDIETLSLEALETNISVEAVIDLIDDVEISYTKLYTRSENSTENMAENNPIVISMVDEKQTSSTSSYMLDIVLQNSFSSYSAWTTKGSEQVSPVLFYTQGLPDISGLSTMITGLWQQGSWRQPYQLHNDKYD